MTDSIDEAALEAWLGAHLGADRVTIGESRRPTGQGFSAVTVMLDAEVERDGTAIEERYVLRMETPEPPIYPPQSEAHSVEIDIQRRVMEALADHSRVPVAPVIGHEDDPGVLGSPFFVMGFVDGVVPIENPVYTSEGFFVEARPEERSRLVREGLATMAAVHEVDWRAAGLDWLVPGGSVPGSRAQLDLWERWGRQELRGRDHPLLDEAFRWLHANLPDDDEVGLCWGDPRPGNIIWRDFQPVCATDFEAVFVGPPVMDLAWWLMFDRTTHDLSGVPHLAGEPDRDEQRRLYFELSGRTPVDTTAHEILAAARYSVIVVRVMNRWEDRGDLGPDHTVWRDNPATACLDVLMQERP